MNTQWQTQTEVKYQPERMISIYSYNNHFSYSKYMVRKNKIVEVQIKPETNEEAKDESEQPSGETTAVQASDHESLQVEPITEAIEMNSESEEQKPARKPKNKILDMPTTPKSSSKQNARRVSGK